MLPEELRTLIWMFMGLLIVNVKIQTDSYIKGAAKFAVIFRT